MLINYDDQIKKVNDVRTGVLKEAPKIGLPELDKVIRFKRNLTCFAGHANVGKTSTLLYLMSIFALKHGTKYLVFSSENEAYTLIRKIIEYLCVRPVNLISEEEFKQKQEFVFEHFKFIDSEKNYDYIDLLNLANLVHKQWAFDCLVIDPINSLRKNKDKMKFSNAYEYNYEMMTDVRIFIKKLEVAVWVCMHSVTEAFRKRFPQNHIYAGMPMPISMSDVEGGNVFSNRTDDFYVFHRLTQHPSRWIYTELHARKIKDHDTGTMPTGFDKPLILESIKNNVGYKIGENQAITPSIIEQLNLPF